MNIMNKNGSKMVSIVFALLAFLFAACSGGSQTVKNTRTKAQSENRSSEASLTKSDIVKQNSINKAQAAGEKKTLPQNGKSAKTAQSKKSDKSKKNAANQNVIDAVEDGLPSSGAVNLQTDKLIPRVANSILLCGDILIEEELLNFMDDFGVDYPIKEITPILTGYDIVFANLETPIGTEGVAAKNKPYIFMINEKYASPIKKLNLTVVSIANNHIMDYGETGLFSTMNWLKHANLPFIGAGKDLRAARTPAVINRNGIEFVFLAYNGRPPASFAAKENSPGAAPAELSMITEDVKKYKKPSNIVMVSLHWGIEQTLYPQPYQVELAYKIIEAGADCIIGHHPHWIQGIEIYRQKPIFYSLGNMLNGFYNRIEQDNFFAVLRYRGLKLRRIEILPIAGKNTMTDFQPYLMTGDEAVEHLSFIKKISARFNTHFVIKQDTGFVFIH